MKSIRIYFCLVATLVLWASAFVGIRVGLNSYTPGALALLRFMTASVMMAFIYFLFPADKSLKWKEKIQLLFLGFFAIGIYNICLNFGKLTVTAGIASFIIGLIPVFTILFSVMIFRDYLNPLAWIGVFISLAGLGILVIADSAEVQLGSGTLSILISSVMGAIYTISQRPFLKRFHPVVVTAWVMWGGTLMLMWFSKDLWGQWSDASLKATATAIYMGIFPAALAYLAWNYVLHSWEASKASVFLYALPLLSTVLGMIILDEKPSLLSLTGGVIAVGGAVAANYWLKPKPLVL